MTCVDVWFVRSAAAFTPAITRRMSALLLYNGDDESNESESSANDLDDWREFQQRLMASEDVEKSNENKSKNFPG